MPTYTFEDKDTGEVFDKLMKISEKEQYLKDNPNLKSVLTVPTSIFCNLSPELSVIS